MIRRSPSSAAALASTLVVALLGLGCSHGSSSDAGPPNGAAGAGSFVDFDPFPTTHMLTNDDVAGLTSAAEDGTLTFGAPSGAVASLQVGDVLLAGISPTTPKGLLRVVLAVDHGDGGALVLTTAAAPLQLAFRTLHGRSTGTIDPIGDGAFAKTDVSPLSLGLGLGVKPQTLRPQWTAVSGVVDKSQSYEIIVFDGDGNPDTTNDQVKIDTTLSGGFTYDLSLDIDWGAVTALPKAVTDCVASLKKIVAGKPPSCSVEDLMPELKLIFTVDPRLAAEVKASGAASLGFEKNIDVGVINLPPFAIGPLVFVPSADIVAKISGTASASFSASAHASVEIESKATLSSKSKNTQLDPFTVKSADAGADTPEVDLFASVKAEVGVRLNLALFSVAGPYATASAVAELDANPLSNPCWDLKLALEAQLGVRVTSPELPLLGYVTFVDWHADPFRPFEKTVASGTCQSTPDGANPPGGGPTAKLLQVPGFKPWSKVLGGPVDGSAVPDVSAFTRSYPFLAPAIDGRYLAGGGGALGLFKIDDHGDGSLTWTRQVIPQSALPHPLSSLASAPALDGGIVTLFASADTAALVVAKHGQSGELVAARAYDLPGDCVAVPALLANDRTSGFVVAGSCRGDDRTWFVHLDSNLGVVRVRTMLDPDPNAIHLVPTTLVRAGDELVVAGTRSRANQPTGDADQMFVVRLDDQENASVPAAFACADRVSLAPIGGAHSADGAVTFVGDATGVAFVARIKKDDSLGFITFPQRGTGVRDWFVPAAVGELPTTGLVVALSSGVLGGDPPVVSLLGLDGAGHTQWANDYALSQASGLRAFAWPSLRITDDGGVLVTGYAGPEGTATDGGALVAMKVFAKDGTLGANGTAGPVTQSAFAPTEGTYAVATRAFAPTLTDASATEDTTFALQR